MTAEFFRSGSGSTSAFDRERERTAAAGFSPTAEPATVEIACEPPPRDTRSAPCDVAQLEVTLSRRARRDGTGASMHVVALDRRRRADPIDERTGGDYRRWLGRYDLILEAVAVADSPARTQNIDTGVVDPMSTGHLQPLDIIAAPTSADTHNRTEHPTTVVRARHGDGEMVQRGEAAAYVTAKLPAQSPIEGSSFWEAVWPFGRARARRYEISTEACGVRADACVPNRDLQVLVNVLPEEEWLLIVGVDDRAIARSARRSRQVTYRGMELRAHSRRQNSRSVDERSEVQLADTRFADSHHYGEYRDRRLLGREVELLAGSDSTEAEPTLTLDHKLEARKVRLQRTLAGRQHAVESARVIDAFLAAADLFSELGRLLDRIPKAGLSVGYDVEFLTGNLALRWGTRWPATYAENHRVHYVERFCEVSGTADLFKGKLEASFGFLVDPPFAPVYLEGRLLLVLHSYFRVSGAAQIASRGPGVGSKDSEIRLDVDATATAQLGGQVAGMILGYSVRAMLRLEGEVAFSANGKLGLSAEPEMIVRLESKGLFVVGEVVSKSRKKSKRRALSPLEVVPPKTFVDDENVWA